MGFVWYCRSALFFLALLSIIEPILLLVLHGKMMVTWREYIYIINLSFTKQISLQGFFTLYFIGLQLVKHEERLSIVFVYILMSNIGFLIGSIIGGLTTIHIL
jgi:hypothetical protein